MDRSSVDEKRILLIEDEPGIIKYCEKTLGAEGFRVEVADDGVNALEQLRKQHYALYIVDIRTPRMNGIELYNRLKQEQCQAVNRIIFITGDVLNSKVKSLLEESGRPFLLKPFTPSELRRCIKEGLKKASQGHLQDPGRR